MKSKRIVMWACLLVIMALIVLSVLGAFYGASKAKFLFNSIPLRFFWYGFAVLLIVGFFEFPRLLKKPSLLIIHVGFLLVLAGGMWGSEQGHQLAKRFFGINKIPNGYMIIYEGHTEKRVMNENFSQLLGELDFEIKLKDFRLEYYEADHELVPTLYIKTPNGEVFELAAKVGGEISLGQDKGSIRILKTFTDFKINFEDDKKVVTEGPNEGGNPAVEVEIDPDDGKSYSRFVFERFADFHGADGRLQMIYVTRSQQMVRDYFSDLVVIEDGKEIAAKTIEVNHPLHWRGYHFYQSSYDSQAGQYTILSVTSDSGLYAVYSGYWLLGIGIFWQFWFRHIAKYFKSKKTNEALE